MKRIICFALLLCLLVPVAWAESLEELQTRRDALLQELTEINSAIGKIMKEEKLNGGSEEFLGRIIDLFPDEVLAMYIRDQCAKFSINQSVTQEELDEITNLDVGNYYSGYGNIKSLVGIGYISNLNWLCLDSCDVSILPEELRNCKKLRFLDLEHTKITKLPDWIGEFEKLKRLSISYCEIKQLPDSVGNLSELDTLYIDHTKITSLPDSIWNLTLDELNMQGLPIK